MHLVQTKLHPPRHLDALCERDRLIPTTQTPLTVIYAPTGFGKTTLATQMIQDAALACWLSIDEHDDDIQRFWFAVISGLEIRNPELGKNSAMILRQSDSTVWDAIVCLLNEINQFMIKEVKSSYFIWDDFHHLTSPELLSSINFFIDHLPYGWKIIITCRNVPPIKLAHRKSKGLATEINARDLRFTEDESIIFLKKNHVKLSAQQYHYINKRCDGWVAALKIYSLAAFDSANKANELCAEKDIYEILFHEVLLGLPEVIITFLKHTAVLPRFCADLVQHVTGDQTAASILAQIKDRHLFVISLDEEQGWYRYHDLFKDFILNKYRIEIDRQHQIRHCAAIWLEDNGLIMEAIDQYIFSESWKKACNLLVSVGAKWLRQGDVETLRRIYARVPDQEWQRYPELLCLRFWMASDTEKYSNGEFWLNRASELIDREHSSEYLICEIMTLKALLARIRGHWHKTIEYSHAALRAAGEVQSPLRWRSFLTLGAFAYLQGDLINAESLLRDAVHWALIDENLYGAAQSCGYLSEVLYQKGELRKAWRISVDLERNLTSKGFASGSRLGAWRWIGQVDLHREKGNFDLAENLLFELRDLRQLDSCEALQHLIILIRSYTLAISQKNLELAFDITQEIETIQNRMHFKSVFASGSVDGMRAEIAWRRGDVPACARWLEKYNLLCSSTVSFIDQRDELVAIRILVMLDRSQDALSRAETLAAQAASGGQVVTQIVAMIWIAICEYKNGRPNDAKKIFLNALAKVSEEGYTSLFSDQGHCLIPLLKMCVSDSYHGAWSESLIRQMAVDEVSGSENVKNHGSAQLGIHSCVNLSSREKNMLNFVKGGYSDKEIARLANISVGTVKTHLRNIYKKLEVSGRVQALSKLDLLMSGHQNGVGVEYLLR